MKIRIEQDALGKFPVPLHAYYGIFTARALKNFQLTGSHAPRIFIRAIGLIKQACAEVNFDLGLLPRPLAKAITQAAHEFSEGKFDEEFPLDTIQAGAGTPFNMNANEVIANRSNEILGAKNLGAYDPVHPNNHVNMAQSSNDVIPAAIRVAALFLLPDLLNKVSALATSISAFARKHARLIKVGRTHLEDAVPITLGQEFGAYASMLIRSHARLKRAAEELHEIGLGGTALGTGINTHPSFQKKIVAKLSALTRLKLSPASDLFEITSSAGAFINMSAAVRGLAIDIIKISNDLKLLNMGPLAGLTEITLPKVEPGSSIMPGKVNPSVAEAAHMAGYDAIASDHAIALGAQAGQLELNVMTPLIIKHLLGSMQLMANTCEMLRNDCIEGITVNKKNIKKLFDSSLVTATALSPYIGYAATAELVKEALATGRSLVYVLRRKKLLDDADIARILSPEYTVRPAAPDAALKKKIKSRGH